MANENLETIIREFIAQNILFNEQGFPYADDASFLTEGVIDSIGVMELVSFVGNKFQIEVDPQEITPENFDSVRRLADFVRRNRKSSTEGKPAVSAT